MEEELDGLFPAEEVVRVIAHPERRSLDVEGVDCEDKDDQVRRMTDLQFNMVKDGERRRMLVAVG